jgi:hypothetical protein
MSVTPLKSSTLGSYRCVMKRYIKLSIFLSLLIGCNEDPAGTSSAEVIDPGIYSGQFFFTEKNDSIVSTVQFTFAESTYTCVPQMLYHPPAGAGKYRMHGDSVELRDLSAHTANFDWTLILDGNFGFRRSGATITLSQKDDVRERTRRIELSKLE